VISPLAATRVKVPEILLPLIFCIPLAGITTLFDINKIAPVVFTLKLVKVLLLIFCDKLAAVLMIYVWVWVPATEYAIPLISLFCIESAQVGNPPVLLIPSKEPELAAL
jgi:hypothetical protein